MTRRELLLRTGRGFGAVALAGLLEAETTNPLAPKPTHSPAKAKSIIYLFMHGGVSHVDTFDPKPELTKRSGQPLSVELAKTIKTSFIHDPTKAILRGSPWEFRPGGKSGLPCQRSLPARARSRGRYSRHPRLLWRCVRSCARDLSAQLRVAVPGTSVPGILGDLRSRQREPEPAGFRGDVGWFDKVRARLPMAQAFFRPCIKERFFAAGENPILYLRTRQGV